jgi:hypothetical protein
MTIADEARANALHCEMVKYAYRQTKDGVVVSFVVHPNDVPAALSISHIGARYMVALVQIGDDEQPIPPAEKEKISDRRLTSAPPQPDTPRQAGAKRDWRDLPPAQQAGIRCEEATFAAFLKEQRPDDWHEAPKADDCVRLICGVHSRAELGTNQKARVIWKILDTSYQAWKAVENA